MAIYNEFAWIFALKKVIFHGYVKLPEGICPWYPENLDTYTYASKNQAPAMMDDELAGDPLIFNFTGSLFSRLP